MTEKERAAHEKLVKDMTGQTVNGVKVLRRHYDENSKAAMWLCVCPHCGKEFVANGGNLRAGGINSCGCRARYKRGDPLKRPRPTPRTRRAKKTEKYGCEFCAEHCAPDEPCKYAAVLDGYADYKEYDEEQQRLFVGLGLDD